MMRLKRISTVLISAALLLGGPILRAQTQDSTAVVKKNKNYSVSLAEDATKYKLQGRYSPSQKEFHKGSILSNTYVTLTGAAYRQFANSYSNGPYANLTLGKWFSPLHGMELSGGACSFKDNYDGVRMYVTQARLSYMFNISAYAGGYDATRLVELYGKAGLGYGIYLREDFPRTGSASAHLGVQVNIHVLPQFDLVLEPLLEAQLDARKLPRMDVWRNYLLALQGGVGLKYNLDPMRRGGDPGLNWFVMALGGVLVQNSDFDRSMGIKESFGPLATIGVGRQYTPAFALRLQIGSSSHYWKDVPEGTVDVYGNPMYTGKFRSTYFYSRLEAKFDMLRLSEDSLVSLWAKYRQVGFSALVGPEVGYMIKKDPNLHDVRYPYVGLSAGLQASVRLFAGLYLLVEPHLSIVPYSASSLEWATRNKDYYDALMGVSMGFEYRFGRFYL